METMCRICGANLEELDQETIHIFENNGKIRKIYEKIESCLPVIITKDDPYSKLICGDCVFKLENFYCFQVKSKETDINLKNNGAVKIKQEPLDYEESGPRHQEFLFCEPLQSLTEEEEAPPSEDSHTMHVVYKCAYCGLKFSDYDVSEAHIRKNHQKERAARLALKNRPKTSEIPPAKPAVQTKTTTMFRCTYCSLMFTTREATATHVLENHKKERQARFALSEIKQNTAPPPSTSTSGEAVSSKESSSGVRSKDKSSCVDITIYRCKYCSDIFGSLDLIHKHIAANHKNALICFICNCCFTSNVELSNHMNTQHVQAAKSLEDLRGTLQAGKPFKCDYCHSKFATEQDLKTHEQKCWIPKLKKHKKNIECDFCGAKYYDKKTLEQHMLRCHVCVYCDKIYLSNTLNSLRYHKRNHELGLESRKVNVCNICGAKFVQKSSLTIHTRKHTGERPYQCNVCPKNYASREGLRKHVFLHSGVKLFKCEYCEKSFARADYLKVHILTHTGERPHMCDICGKCFTQQSSLVGHRRLHDNEYTCDECGHVSNTRASLLRHMKLHL